MVCHNLGLPRLDSFQNHTEKILVTEILEMFAVAADVLCHKKQIFPMFLRDVCNYPHAGIVRGN